ncbi:MAG TPA: diacylglycerol kinase family protein [Candidatus Binatia bacterium]|nr:diacylglycerol kinase family protein [Candidatus Binatia bacterium]
MQGPIVVILNASAGGSPRGHSADEVAALFRARGVEAEVWLADGGSQIRAAARRAAQARPAAVVAGGGDGTVNAVAAELLGKDVALGVLPLGTLNHFAKDVGIPLELAAAVAAIVAGHTRRIDVGCVNERIFLNNSSLGLYPAMVREREARRDRGWSKWIAFAWASVKTLLALPFVRARIDLDGHPQQRRSPFVFIGNNRYRLNGAQAGRRDDVEGGELSLYTAPHQGRLGLLRLMLRALTGRLRPGRDLEAHTAREIVIRTSRARQRVSTDGELCWLETPLRYRVKPAALRVLAPPADH